MTKSPWTVDVKTHKATHTNGSVATFVYSEGQWGVDDINGDMDTDFQLSLEAWNSELQTAINHLIDAGEALYSRDFINPLAKKIGVNRTTIQRWLSGETPLTMGYPKWPDVITALEARSAKIISARDAIAAAHNAAQPIVSGRYAGAKMGND